MRSYWSVSPRAVTSVATRNTKNMSTSGSSLPLITIGIPTYNRPNGLRAALDSAISQSFTDIAILVSDNASSMPAVADLIHEYESRDRRVKAFTQSENIGATRNFMFLVKQANSPYFIWLADDDAWPAHHLESLFARMDESCTLTFPNVTGSSASEQKQWKGIIQKYYLSCKSDGDYLRAWLDSGAGYPVYGLYNLQAMFNRGLKFEFSEDLVYFNEGLFLHKLFIKGGARFVPETSLFSSLESRKPDMAVMLSTYVEYLRRVLLLYLEVPAFPSPVTRETALDTILQRSAEYMRLLCELPAATESRRFHFEWWSRFARFKGSRQFVGRLKSRMKQVLQIVSSRIE